MNKARIKPLKQCPDRYILNLWRMDRSTHLGETYRFIAEELYHAGYEGVTIPAVRRQVKKVLKNHKLIPARPTLSDYLRSKRPPKHADDLN